MDKSSPISEMEKFHFGGKVFCADGEDGTLSHLGVDPSSQRIVSLGVKTGRFFGKTVYVPFSAVTDASGNGITLSISRDELNASTAQSSGSLLDARSTVQESGSNSRGTLKLIAAHPQTGELAYIVVRSLRAGQDVLILQQYFTKIDAGTILINVPEPVFQTLPPYRTDEELQREVEDVIYDMTPIHIDFPGMKNRVLDSVLYLDGNISSSLRGEMVEDQASGVPGLLEIQNHLVGDDTLAADLAMALGRDERTRDLPIGVYPRLGAVRLSGFVRTAEQKAAAEQIARSYPGVRSVENGLIINSKSDLLNVMASSAGGEGEDIVPGRYVRHTK
ncbi:BON domain-containing protein [Dictyobacter aurantiacus]|uniref:BON domain-containing protein n=1 Tax=Dictyobacter aurantiacus TaxID=1936993 RepID=A0A401Z9R8_9CHLR|nr:BON domain-containing protein [Dictyobacter aurantiacus]GCE03595.1 hypothetical protein KDAU_09240 [Dictyobacter aurantiacus]